tara:strand:- start:145 stop:1758 length:1614 start_codon:yes stop_codon:yes gene_type:complete
MDSLVKKSSIKKYFLYWVKTRNFYCNWISKTSLRHFFSENDNKIYELSPWWATTLVSKDNLNNKKWYQDLDFLINKKKTDYKVNKNNLFFIIITLKLSKNFIKEVFWLIFIKLISFTRFISLKNKKNCFHSYNYNFFWDQDLKTFTDRSYGYAFKKKNLNQNFYLISVIKRKEFLKRLFNFRDNKKIISDEFLQLKQILYVYFKSVVILFKLLKYTRKEKKLFYINKVNCRSVLEPLLISSFSGEIQNSILRGLAIKNFLEKKRCEIFLSYGEFTPQYRPVYFFIKSLKNPPTIFTFQHGNANKNLLYNCNNKNDFTFKNIKLEGTTYSPKPDFYFTQGAQFDNILKKYFKNTKIIGPIKYDGVSFKKKVKKNKTKKIVICPSVGDDEVILNMLNAAVSAQHKYFISPHPTYKFIAKKFINKLSKKCDIRYLENVSTRKLVAQSDLVIAGFSSMVYEATIMGIPSLRLISLQYPHYHETNDKVKMIFNSLDLKKILSQKSFAQLKFLDKNKVKNYMFYKLDNKSFLRMWSNIKKYKN